MNINKPYENHSGNLVVLCPHCGVVVDVDNDVKNEHFIDCGNCLSDIQIKG